jgi:hypothetical protein
VASSNHSTPFQVNLTFFQGKRVLSRNLLRPYCFPEPARDFLSFGVPAGADRCLIEVLRNRKLDWYAIDSLELVLDEPVVPMAAMD